MILDEPTILTIFLAFILTLLASVGATLIITTSYLFRPLQNAFTKEKHPYLYKLFRCPMCMGVYVGMFLQFIIMLFVRERFAWDYILFNIWDIVPIIFQGFATSIISYLVFLWMLSMEDENI